MADEIKTGGGAATEGSVGSGRDFVGRDIITNNYDGGREYGERRFADIIWDEIRDIKRRVGAIEEAIKGSTLEDGLRAQVKGLKDSLRSTERKIELVDTFDSRIEHIEELIKPLARRVETTHQPLHPWTIAFLVISVIAMSVSLFVALVLPRL